MGSGDDRVKQCKTCLQFKPCTFEFFYNDKRIDCGLSNVCKVCKNWRNRNYKLEKILGISEREYILMMTSQRGVCAICERSCKTNQRLSVDHCHKTGRVRGLLCKTCNSALGLYNDDPNLLRRAADYLDE